MKIAVIGAGALGLYYGALLQRAGNDVQFLLRSDYEAISEKGLQVYSKDGDFHLPKVKGYRSSAEMEPVDLVLIGLKTTSNRHMVELVKPLMGDGATILTLQNGLGNEEILAEAFGEVNILGGTAFLCSNRKEAGAVHHLDYGPITLGSFTGGHRLLLKSLEKVFNQAEISCSVTDCLLKARWQKLVWNIPFNGMCAHTNRTTAQLLADEGMTAELRAVMIEVIDAANAELEQLGEDAIDEVFSDSMIAATRKMADYRPSMLIDRDEGRPFELEAIYRTPIDRAAQNGVDMPRTSLLSSLLSLE